MKKLWKYLKIIITIGVISYFVYYFFHNKEDFSIVLSTQFRDIFLIGVLYFVVFLLNGVFIKLILKSFDKNITVFECLYVSVISSLGNYFLPMRGGAVIRSVYLKKKFNFQYSHFVSTLYGYYVIVFLVNSFFALLSLFYINSKFGLSSIPLYLFFGGLFLFMLFLSLIRFPIAKIKINKTNILNRIVKVLTNILKGWNMIVENKVLLRSLIVNTLMTFLVHIILYWIEFNALGIENSFVNVILYSSLSGVSLLVSLTPGSLGIREGIFVITSDILSITGDQVMQLALLDRGIMVLVLILIFIIIWIQRNFIQLVKRG